MCTSGEVYTAEVRNVLSATAVDSYLSFIAMLGYKIDCMHFILVTS